MFHAIQTVIVTLRSILVTLCLIGGAIAGEPVPAEPVQFDIDEQPLSNALTEFARQSDREILFSTDAVEGKDAHLVVGVYEPEDALELLLADTGLEYSVTPNDTILVAEKEGGPESGNVSATLRPIPMAQASEMTEEQNEVETDDNVKERPVISEEIEEIIVTGTNIRGLAVGPSPVLTFDREDIVVSGAGTLREFLATIPQNFGGGANTGNQIRSAGTGGTTSNGFGTEINLRGLGTGTTLTLLNGRRLTTSEAASFVDITAIPLSAIERVEVVTDGASAIYGSDAIGGVVNIILRKDFEGFETRARYGSATRGEPDEYGFSQAAGAAWNSGQAFLTVDHFKQESLPASERSFSEDADFLPIDLIPQSKRLSFFGTGSQDLGDKASLSVDAFYSTRDVDFVINSVQGISEFEAKTELYGGALAGTVELSRGWQGVGAVGGSESDLISTSADVGGVGEFGNTTRTWFTDLTLEGPLFALPGGTMRLAVGGSFRQAKFDVNVPSSNGVPLPELAAAFDRDVAAVFAEFYIPVVGEDNRLTGVERFEVSAAVRYDDYSDVGSTTNPKFGALWEITPGLLLRGTYGTSFRVPNLTDLDASNTAVVAGNLPTDVANFTNPVPTLWISGGNPELAPEEATTWTAGIEWRPPNIEGLSAEVSYYNIDYDERMGQPGTLLEVAINEGGAFNPVITLNPSVGQINSLVAADSDGPLVFTTGLLGLGDDFDFANIERIFDLRLNNIAIVAQNGLDYSVEYSFEAGAGDLALHIGGDYILNSTERVTSTSPENSILNKIFNPVDLTFRSAIVYSNGSFQTAIFANHVAEHIDNFSDPEKHIPPWTTVDLTMSYGFVDLRVIDRFKLSASIRNIFDEDPPMIDAAIGRGTGFDPTNANPLGRFISLNITTAW